MSEIRTHLEAKARDPREWLRREPRETHPAIVAAVRECIAGAPAGRTGLRRTWLLPKGRRTHGYPASRLALCKLT